MNSLWGPFSIKPQQVLTLPHLVHELCYVIQDIGFPVEFTPLLLCMFLLFMALEVFGVILFVPSNPHLK